MKSFTHIDSSGRLVIPKELRRRYGLEAGQKVRIVPSEEGVTLIPDLPKRRLVKRGPLLTIDTGAGVAPLDAFDVLEMRRNHLKEKDHADRG